MSVRTDSDDRLMAALAAGDAEAFRELMRRHRGWVRSLMCAFVRNEEQAEDLTQELFCRVYRRADEYRGEGRFIPWVKRVAVNLAKDALRGHRNRATVSMDHPDFPELPDPDCRKDPLEVLTSGALQSDIRDALQRLPRDQQLALAMYYFDAMSLQDVARALNCPVGTVKSRLHNGLRRLRHYLAARWEGENDER